MTDDAFVMLVSRLAALIAQWHVDGDETRAQCARELAAAVGSVAEHRQQES